MSKDERYVIGIDSGTESVRVNIFDLNGFKISGAKENYPTYSPKPRWSEQSMDDIWNSLKKACRKAVGKLENGPKNVVGIGVDGTCSTVVASDSEGDPLDRAILWNDKRAAEQAEKASEIEHKVLKYCGGEVSAESMTAKALWIKENRPQIWKKTENLCESMDWITWKMTGNWTASIANATRKWNYSTELGGWSRDFFEDIGLGDIFEKWPEDVLPIGEKKGTLTKEAADELGLLPGIPVAEGCFDSVSCMIGLDAYKPGRLAVTLGSSTALLACSKKPVFGSGIFLTGPEIIGSDLWLHITGEPSTGSILRWFKNEFGAKEVKEAEKRDKNPYEILDKKAEDIPLGSGGVIALEHWQGSRVRADPLSRGVLQGLSLDTTRIHLYRAIMEACAYSMKLGIDIFEESGIEVDEVRVTGGGAISDTYLQIHSDVIGLPIYRTRTVRDSASLGSAILAAVSSEEYKDIFEAGDKMVEIEDEIEPREENTKKYKFYYNLYKEIYPNNKESLRELSRYLESS